jgi:MYXO-CTERM domain-containing protein
VSLVPSLTGDTGQRDKGYLYFEFFGDGATPDFAEFPNHGGAPRGEMQAVRVGNTMGVRTQVLSAEDDFQIYDVVNDPAEQYDLSAAMPELQAEMKTLAIRGRRPGADVVRPYDGAVLPASVAPLGLINGVSWKRYTGPFPWVPEFRDLLPTASGSDTNFAPAKHAPDCDSGLFYEGFIQTPAAGDYTFYVASDAGASLHIHDAHVIDDDYNHDDTEIAGTIALAAGVHAYRLYYRHAGAAHVLDVKWSGPNLDKQTILPGNLLYDPPADPDGAAGDGDAAVGSGARRCSGSGGDDGAAAGDPAGCACSVVSARPQSGTKGIAGWLALLGLALLRRPRTGYPLSHAGSALAGRGGTALGTSGPGSA